MIVMSIVFRGVSDAVYPASDVFSSREEEGIE